MRRAPDVVALSDVGAEPGGGAEQRADDVADVNPDPSSATSTMGCGADVVGQRVGPRPCIVIDGDDRSVVRTGGCAQLLNETQLRVPKRGVLPHRLPGGLGFRHGSKQSRLVGSDCLGATPRLVRAGQGCSRCMAVLIRWVVYLFSQAATR